MADKRVFTSILCPVDFSEHSRQALSYAALLSSRLGARLNVIFVEHPMLATAAAIEYDEKSLIDKERLELRRFTEKVIAPYGLSIDKVTLDVASGRPHQEIVSTAEHLGCDLIVMGSHGATGVEKAMLGSTTHRILRQSRVPVLATPPVRPRTRRPSANWPGPRALAPVDLSERDRLDALTAAVVARELGTKLELVHVVEPIGEPPWLRVDAARRDLQRQRRALARLTSLKDELAWAVADCRVEFGKPATSIATAAMSADVGLVILTRRRGQGLFGPRQGAISYHVLCEAGTPVLALPADTTWRRRAVALRPRTRGAR